MSSLRAPMGNASEMLASDDLNGSTTTLDLTGALGCIIVQANAGAAGTAGIDVVQISKDGSNWETATIRDAAGDTVADGALNAAGAEPDGAAVFTLEASDGQLSGPTTLRVVRDGTNGTSEAWVTGAPQVLAVRIG